MSITVDATYDNGTLRLSEPLPLKEHERVRVTVHRVASPLLEAYGIAGWTGDAETIERVALDPEYLPEETP